MRRAPADRNVGHLPEKVEIAIAKFYTSLMRFDWDPNKAASNLKDHRVSFEEATTVFGDPLSETYDDPDHSITERRCIIIGTSERGRLLFVAHADDGQTIRNFSTREPTRGERKYYEENQ